jgi:hypothetical protein
MRKKEFDCVQMKHDIQQRLLEEMAGLSLEERRRRMEERIAANPILGRLWREARRVQPAGEPTQKP